MLHGYRQCNLGGIRPSSYGRFVRAPRRAAKPFSTVPTTAPDVVVTEVLHKIEGTDGGLTLSDQQKDEVDSLLDQLQAHGQGSRPLDDERLWGNWEVKYTSTRRAPGQQGQPASASGGRFRGAIGRALFQTTGLFQSVFKGKTTPIATNKVGFKLFRLLPGYVGLRGVVQPYGDAADTVNVFFDPPVLSIMGLTLRIGPKSSVRLTTTYLDERVRIGKGSFGSLFVFSRGAAAEEAGMDMVGLEKAVSGGVAASVLLAGALVVGTLMWVSKNPLLRMLACVMGLLAVGLAAVLRRGGTQGNTMAATEQPAAAGGPAKA